LQLIAQAPKRTARLHASSPQSSAEGRRADALVLHRGPKTLHSKSEDFSKTSGADAAAAPARNKPEVSTFPRFFRPEKHKKGGRCNTQEFIAQKWGEIMTQSLQ
jgi:hypothetical protein